MGTWVTCLLLAATLTGDTVQVKRLSGADAEGELRALSTTQVELATATGSVIVPATDLLGIEFKAKVSTLKPRVWVRLLDGSVLHGTDFTFTSGAGTLQLLGGAKATLAARQIQWVRFRAHDRPLATQWQQIVDAPKVGDLLIVRKTSVTKGKDEEGEPAVDGAEIALDTLEGAILEVASESVQFKFEGETIAVKREKLDGLMFQQPTSRPLPAPLCRLVDSFQSQLLVKSLDLKGTQVVVTTVGGVQLEFPLAKIQRLDFSAGNVIYLGSSELPWEADKTEFDLGPASVADKLSQLFAPQRITPENSRFWLQEGKQLGNGLVVHGPAKLVFRLPAGFRQFQATIGLPEGVAGVGSVSVKVLLDGKEVGQQTFMASERTTPWRLLADLGSARRLTLEVESASGGDLGDWVILGEARVSK